LANTNTNKDWQIPALANIHIHLQFEQHVKANKQQGRHCQWDNYYEGVGKLGGGAPIAFVFVMLTPRLSWKINKPVDGHWRLSAEWVCILIKPVFRWLLSDADRTCTPTHPPYHYQVLKIKLDNASGERGALKKIKIHMWCMV